MSSEPTTTQNVEANTDQSVKPVEMDPFANQRDATSDPFAEQKKVEDIAGSDDMALDDSADQEYLQRRLSKEWDASKVPPSQFQKRKGSIYATPKSRDAHVGSDRDKAYHEKLKEKGWNILKGKTK